MVTRTNSGAHGTRIGRTHGLALAMLLAITLGAKVAESKITIRPDSPFGAFFFHGQYSKQPFDPASAIGVEIWSCANGAMPAFIADREPLVVCSYDPTKGYILGEQVYGVELPAGACRDHGRSCFYRDPRAASRGGIRYARVEYARRGHANRVWLESFGDLSAADQAKMLVLITIDGIPRATLQDTFSPLRDGGWFSPY